VKTRNIYRNYEENITIDMHQMTNIKVDESLKSREILSREQLVDKIHTLIRYYNNGYKFEKKLAEEWVDYLLLLLKGNKDNLSNPYNDIQNYNVESLAQSTPGLKNVESLFFLDSVPKKYNNSKITDLIIQKSVFIIALGGTDSTFYKYLTLDEEYLFAQEFYTADLVAIFQKYNAVHLIPRGFVAKRDISGRSVTNVESMIMQAYAVGIRNIAVIANAATCRAFEEYFEKFRSLKDLNIIVTAQPLLPRIKLEKDQGVLCISSENEGYPGGHGHGFKYCLIDKRVRDCIEKNDLRYFIFTNGDNAAVLNWGGDHFEKVLGRLDELKEQSQHQNLRIGFFLVWEFLRKGGFSFLLTNKKTGEKMPQIFEAELAQKSGADISRLKESRGGYNTNVAVGIIQDVYTHLQSMPLALKEKVNGTGVFYSFEASLATAMTTLHTTDGKSKFDPYSAINILGPKDVIYQHWNHIALRKREDLFAFHSSLYKIEDFPTKYGTFPIIHSQRDATKKYPTLLGNFIDHNVLNTKSFYEIFANAFFDVDQFYGSIYIDLLEENDLPRGKIVFEKNVTLIGNDDSFVEFIVPAGEKWLVINKTFHVDKKRTITREDIIVQKWDAEKKVTFEIL